MTTYSIYALLDPRSSAVRYVGMTNDIVERFIQHLRCGEVNIHKNMWVVELKNLGLIPLCRTVQVCSNEREAREVERNWIAAFLEIDQPLFNHERTGKR